MGKLFGTDGIRGVVNAGLDADLAYKVGLAAAEVLASGKKAGEKPLVTIGRCAGSGHPAHPGGGLGDGGREGGRRHRHLRQPQPL